MAIFQYPQKSSSAQGWQGKGECHSAGWRPVWGKDISMKVADGLGSGFLCPPSMKCFKHTTLTQLFLALTLGNKFDGKS